ncbi:hypothetical protein CGLO_12862 [Colletotrichum gloeosporioides Cg-14]|uniref:Uncharacterized protein n=1 Tax=Colletotrichum gloeosporioides (strain Cg-14) TaxID=1237896 RepID=T0L8M4_COLGC|nr:hypothetical protein CGLO_12862 [Colletotrichum gloeosporioides Cg-14]
MGIPGVQIAVAAAITGRRPIARIAARAPG